MHVPASTIPIRTLLGLTGAVLLAHLLVVRNIPLGPGDGQALATRVFTTRSLQINPPPVAAPVPGPARTPTVAVPPPQPVRREARVTSPQEAVAAVQVAAVPPTSGPATGAEPLPVAPVPVVQAEVPPAAPASSPAVPEPVVAAPRVVPTPAPVAMPSRNAGLPARAYTVPGSTRLKFNATALRGRFTYQALGELLWQHDGSSYQARLEAGDWIIGTGIGTSRGQITADGLAPDRYTQKAKSELAAHFERDKGRITFSANSPEAELQPGAQDRLSVFLQLASLLAGEPGRYQAGTRIDIQTVTQRAAEPWTFTVGTTETLVLPAGDLIALKLIRLPSKAFDQKIEAWLAPSMGYLPARILTTNANGDFLDLKLRTTADP